MRPDPSLDDLARRVRSRCDDSGGPYVLFLGAGCARAAGAPPPEAIARDALTAFGYDESPTISSEPLDQIFRKFTDYTGKLSRTQFTRMLRSLYAKVPVPAFYQDLALMVRERFFPIIITTNFDTLLELALDGVGLRSSDYMLTTFGASRPMSEPTPTRNLRPRGNNPLTHIIKLHGDLDRPTGSLTPADIDRALESSRELTKGELSRDLIMVGHEPGEAPVDAWLAGSSRRELWWIGQDDTNVPPVVGTWSDDLHVLTGEMARPQIFFQQLALRLLRAPEASNVAADEPADGGLESVPARTGGASPENAPVSPEPDSLADTLQREILRSRSVLTNLSQDVIPGARSAEQQAQIQYQKKRISTVEDRVRLLPEVKPRVVELVNRILARVRGADPSAKSAGDLERVAAYIEHETDTLKRELAADSPNPFIVSASLGATLMIADRLHTEYGDSVIDANDVRTLSLLVPTSPGRVLP